MARITLQRLWAGLEQLASRRSKPTRERRTRLMGELLESRRVLAPVLLADINPGASSSNAARYTDVNGTIYFIANDGVNGQELWKSDGTSAGTVMVSDIRPGASSSNISVMANIDGTLYFTANDGTNGAELWKSDGTSSGTVLVKDIFSGPSNAYPNLFTNVNGTLFFRATDGTNGDELWKSDGTSSGTVLVKDINPGGNSSPQVLANVNGTLFFMASDGTNGGELWKSDGTSGGTVLVKDIYAGSNSSALSSLFNFNGTLYFRATDGTNGYELWKSDGTSGGTVLVKDIYAGASNSTPFYLTNISGTLFFRANDGTNGSELWKSDGTSSGTILVNDINSGASHASPSNLTNVDGTLFFRANDGTNGTELWKSDGTSSGTVMVKDIRPGASGSAAYYLVNGGGTLYFMANDGSNGYELWSSNGTSSGTVMVADIFAGSTGSFPSSLTLSSGNLYFRASDGIHGSEPWVYAVQTTPSVNLSLVPGASFAESGSTMVVATLSSTSAQNVTVDLSFAGSAVRNTDYSASATSIVILAGQLTGSITLTGLNDNLSEASESIVVDVTNMTNGLENGTQQVTAALVDEDRYVTSASTLTISGTTGDDDIVMGFYPGTPIAYVLFNGQGRVFYSVNELVYNSGGGNDHVSFAADSTAVESATMSATSLSYSDGMRTARVDYASTVLIAAQADDTLLIVDTNGNDKLYALPQYQSISNAAGNAGLAIGFGNVTATASSGGNDLAFMYSAATFTSSGAGSSSTSSMTTAAAAVAVNQFETVYAFSQGQAGNTANVSGSNGTELFYGMPTYSVLTGTGVFVQVMNFAQVTANGSGDDTALLYDTTGDETFTGSPTTANLTGVGFSNTAVGFDSVYAMSSGGNDLANFTGGSGDDSFYGFNDYAILYGVGSYLLETLGFKVNHADLTGSGGKDTAYLFKDFSGNAFTASGLQAQSQYSNANINRATGFDSVYAIGFSSNGAQTNVASSLAFELYFV